MLVLRIKQVAERTTLAQGTIRNWVCAGKFPKPFKLGGVNVWDEADLDKWMLTQKQETLK